jgi:hypothetical protein
MGEFLLEMCREGQRQKGKKAFKELVQLLSKEDLQDIRESSKEFSDNFKVVGKKLQRFELRQQNNRSLLQNLP